MNHFQFVQASNMYGLDNYIVDVRNHRIPQFLHDHLVLQLVYKVLKLLMKSAEEGSALASEGYLSFFEYLAFVGSPNVAMTAAAAVEGEDGFVAVARWSGAQGHLELVEVDGTSLVTYEVSKIEAMVAEGSRLAMGTQAGDVIDRREASRLKSVASERKGGSSERCSEHPVDRHIRSLPRAVDGEVPERDDGQPTGGVGAHQVFGRRFGGSIRRQRRRGAVLVDETTCHRAVHAARGGDDDSLALGAQRRLAETLGGNEIVPDVEIEPVGPTRLDTWRAREMDDGIDAADDWVEVDVDEVGDVVDGMAARVRRYGPIECDGLPIFALEAIDDRLRNESRCACNQHPFDARLNQLRAGC